MDNFANSQENTQVLRETQELTPEVLNSNEQRESNVWGRLFSEQESMPVYNLINNSYTFGRGNADYRFNQDNFESSFLPTISKCHFKVSREWNSDLECVVVLEDSSANGTYVNKKLIGKGNKTILQNNDEIAIAHENKKAFVFYDCLRNDASHYPSQLTELYTITKKLGEGNFGEVRLAYKHGTLEKSAIKIIKKRGSQLKFNNTTQIRNEIQLLQSVNHPCIIRFEDVLETSDKIYIIMEAAGGGELFDQLANNGGLPEETAKFYFYQLALALQYLHSRKITHRDIKPENILLGSDEEFTIIKLTDFGLSKLAADASQMTTFCGTITYIAPELLHFGALSYNNKVDIWSLGVVLYVSLAGYAPFHGEDMDVRQQIMNAKYDFKRSVWQGVSDECKDLIRKLMVSEPAKRLDIEQILAHPWLQDDDMQAEVSKLLRLERSSPRKRRLEEIELDEMIMASSKTPRFQTGIGKVLG